ncbi:hypothetical protein Taro_010990 [Colocasia esculenta]|uniref:Uncharacterized protein n=1 Tax=Colocasia esculenta TaxID=4460 RepID=A0A843U0F0_COLES|nr:hypothetical protein [Colocasia esculenta]
MASVGMSACAPGGVPFSRAMPCVPVFGRRPFWGFPEGVPCLPMPARLVLFTSQLCRFLWWLPRLFSFARCSALEGLSRSEVVSFSWDPILRSLLREFSGLRACSS